MSDFLIERMIDQMGGTPYKFYKACYKGTNCGVTIGMDLGKENSMIYNNDLPDKPSIPSIISVGSIVEGVDFDCQTIVLKLKDFTEEKFWQAVQDVEDEAQYIWNQTHGCEDCNMEGEWGHDAIDPNCKTCNGDGAII